MNRLGYLAVCLLVFTIPWENVVLIAGVGTISRLFGFIALGLGVFAVLVSGRLRAPSPFLWLAACFFAFGCLTLFWTIDRDATIQRVWKNIQLMALVWLIWEASGTWARRMGLLKAYVL